jgi:transcription antitermination factor NusG
VEYVAHYGLTDVFDWYVYKVRHKSEKMVSKHLSNLGLEVFVPTILTTRVYSKKIKKVEKPLLYNYVFVKSNKSTYLNVLTHEHVLGFVRVGKDKVRPITPVEMDILRRIVELDPLLIETEHKSLEVGNIVEVIRGQLYGLRGKLVQRQGKRKILIEIEGLDQSIAITVEEEDISKVN